MATKTTKTPLTDGDRAELLCMVETESSHLADWLYGQDITEQETMQVRAQRLGVPYEVACLVDARIIDLMALEAKLRK